MNLQRNEKFIQVWGFGSFFRQQLVFSDIDMLLVHEGNSRTARFFALRCRNTVREKIDKADVCILSERSEREFDFIAQSRATFLGLVQGASFDLDIQNLVLEVTKFRLRVM